MRGKQGKAIRSEEQFSVSITFFVNTISTDESVNKMWYIPTREYHSAIKWNDILIYMTT